MEKVEDSSNGNEKEARVKGVRGISLRACVAKAASWTLEKANSATSQEATTNKQSDSKWYEHIGMWKEHFKLHDLHVILKTIIRTRTLKGGGYGLTQGSFSAAAPRPKIQISSTRGRCTP